MNDYYMLDSGEGVYAINPPLVDRIAYAAGYFEAKWDSRKGPEPVRESGLPDTYRCSFDCEKAQKGGKKAAAEMLGHLRWLTQQVQANEAEGVSRNLGPEVREFQARLWAMEQSTARHREKIWNLQREASSKTMKSIQSRVKNLERGRAVAVGVANLSVDVIAYTLTYATGGAGKVLINGVAATAKGGIKYLETENAGAAALTAASEFGLSFIPIPEGGPKKPVLVALTKKAAAKTAADTVIGVVEGKSLTASLFSSATSAIVGLGFGFAFKFDNAHFIGLFPNWIKSLDIPVNVAVKLSVDERGLFREVRNKAVPKVVTWLLKPQKSEETREAPKVQIVAPGLARYAVMGPDICM